MPVRKTLSLLFVLVFAVLLGGCGGSGKAPNLNPAAPARFTIDWAQRSRTIHAPSSALSAKVVLSHASPTSADVVITVDRRAAPAAYSETYTSAGPVQVGAHPMTVSFYDSLGGAGNVVASGTATVTIGPDGNGIGDIAVANKVQTVVVDPGQVATIDVPTQLTFTARDAEGALVPVSAGSAIWTRVDGADVMNLTSDGVATGLQQGTSNVTASVDGVTSAAVGIVVPVPPQFVNGDFEAPALTADTYRENGQVVGSSWTGDENWGQANGRTYWGRGAHGGNQYAYVQADPFGVGNKHGSLKQTVTNLVVGRSYRVSMWIAKRSDIRTDGSEPGAQVRVLANGTQILNPTFPPTNGTWTQVVTSSFVATQSTYEFVIQAVLPAVPQDQGTLVDDVVLEQQ